MCLSYRAVGLGLLLVAHGHDGQHQVDEVKRSEKYDDGKKYHMDWSAGGHDLKRRKVSSEERERIFGAQGVPEDSGPHLKIIQ